MHQDNEKFERHRPGDERVDEVIRRKFGNCATGSLFEAARPPMSGWFSLPLTGRQLHLIEAKVADTTARSACHVFCQ